MKPWHHRSIALAGFFLLAFSLITPKVIWDYTSTEGSWPVAVAIVMFLTGVLSIAIGLMNLTAEERYPDEDEDYSSHH